MSNLSEEEIKEFLNKYKDCKCDLREYNSCIECENKVKQAIQGLLDLYRKEKEKNKNLSETNKKLYETGLEIGKQHIYTSENYVSKDRINTRIEEIEKIYPDDTMFTKEFLIVEIKALLEE